MIAPTHSPGNLGSQVHLRLGDLNMLNGMYNEAADEFEKCLGHRLALPSPQSRRVADAHVRRAQALFYASTLEGADKVGGDVKTAMADAVVVVSYVDFVLRDRVVGLARWQ